MGVPAIPRLRASPNGCVSPPRRLGVRCGAVGLVPGFGVDAVSVGSLLQVDSLALPALPTLLPQQLVV